MSAEQPQPRRIDDPEVLKGLAQPIRQRLYRLLSQIGPATSGTLAKRVNGDPGLISYHLRELARRGFIEDVPELARDRRERWWRTVQGSTTWAWRDFPTPEGQAVASAVKGQMVADEFARLHRYEQSRESWSEAWQDAATSSDSFLRLTPAELEQVSAELLEVLQRWSRHGRQASERIDQSETADSGESREHVFLFFHAFPERP
ncbi:winged helix-turn-helix domain-containing protein [Rugosimonospora africana]|uniref:Transcriptional regulator n=1 Tax=Rugosimonospora africana TaxID=556532 RepID=A0A8J3VTF3_9ACTN|nr:helix-turn-helix domain-containing protein [Rugosimonospora africana]GIH17443.1 transcriptional regulator [Rugosimonospora africana]